MERFSVFDKPSVFSKAMCLLFNLLFCNLAILLGRAAALLWTSMGKSSIILNTGQTDSQVDASWELGSPCDSVWPGLTCTCVELRWLALTLVEIKFARKSTQVFHRLATSPKSRQIEWRPFAILFAYVWLHFWSRGTALSFSRILPHWSGRHFQYFDFVQSIMNWIFFPSFTARLWSRKPEPTLFLPPRCPLPFFRGNFLTMRLYIAS